MILKLVLRLCHYNTKLELYDYDIKLGFNNNSIIAI